MTRGISAQYRIMIFAIIFHPDTDTEFMNLVAFFHIMLQPIYKSAKTYLLPETIKFLEIISYRCISLCRMYITVYTYLIININ